MLRWVLEIINYKMQIRRRLAHVYQWYLILIGSLFTGITFFKTRPNGAAALAQQQTNEGYKSRESLVAMQISSIQWWRDCRRKKERHKQTKRKCSGTGTAFTDPLWSCSTLWHNLTQACPTEVSSAQHCCDDSLWYVAQWLASQQSDSGTQSDSSTRSAPRNGPCSCRSCETAMKQSLISNVVMWCLETRTFYFYQSPCW